MSINPIKIGAAPNDGTGQDLRSGGAVINANFAELDQRATDAQAKADAAEPKLPGGSSAQVLLGNRTWTDLATAVRGIVLTGLSVATAGAILATDSILIAFGKIQNRLNSLGTAANATLVTSDSDTTVGRVATVGFAGWGGLIQTIMPAGYDANNLTGNRVVAFSEGLNLPVKGGTSGYWFITTLDYGEGYRYQQAANFVISGATFVRQRHAASGWTAWKKLIEQGDYGVAAISNPWSGSAVSPDSFLIAGQYWGQFAMANWSGPGTPTSNVTGYLKVTPGGDSATYVVQEFLNGTNGTSFSRVRDGSGTFTPWIKNFNTVNAETDPQTALGLMSSTVISGWTVSKYVNGYMTMTQTSTSASVAQNGILTPTITIPSGFVGDSIPICSAQPSANFDCYGCIGTYFGSANGIVVILRNGGSIAQTFYMRIIVHGRWK